MTDRISPERRSANMAQIRSKNTRPEWIVRKQVHAMGFRYRLHQKGLPGCPDLVFKKLRIVLFVHGCFWHGHDCKEGKRVPKSNVDYWLTKIANNRARDRSHSDTLAGLGWKVRIIWECQTKDTEKLASHLQVILTG